MKAARLFLFFFTFLAITSFNYAQISSTSSGNWSNGATWVGGIVPAANDDVIIANTVTVDIVDAECNNLTVADGGRLYFALTDGLSIRVNGNLIVESNGRVQAASSTPSSDQYFQTIELKKDLTVNSGGRFDMRQSSGANLATARVVFSGSSNSTISLALTTYTSNTEEFNSVEINKTGGAKVILNSGTLYQSNNSSNGPDTLVLTSGIVETGSNHWVLLRTGSFGVVDGSNSSHFNGILGRGISNSGGNVETVFQIGDGTNYRPVTLNFNAPSNATGHYVWATLLSGDANTGSSTFTGGIDKVSENNYYEIGYLQNAGSAASMPIYKAGPSYTTGDGVNSGNTDLRVAVSVDNRATWINIGPSDHLTDLTNTPTTIESDSLDPVIAVNTGTSFFAALARADGTTTNSIPVELTSFAAAISGNKVELKWTTASEKNNFGFEVERASSESIRNTLHQDINDVEGWIKIGFVPGAGTSTEKMSYSFIDENVNSGSYSYRLKQIDFDGQFTYSNVINADINFSTEFSLRQNYPNPFNPTTKLSFVIGKQSIVSLKVYDVLGKEIATLINERKPAGKYEVNFSAKELPNGVYYYQIIAGDFIDTKKMILLK